MERIRAVGFDLDGTLFDHLGSAGRGVDAFYRELGINPSEDARRLWFHEEAKEFERWRSGHATFHEQRRRRLRSVLPKLGISAPNTAKELDDLFAKYLRAYRAEWAPFPDSLGLLQTIKNTGRRVGVLTNGSQDQQLDKIHAIGFGGIFDVISTSEQIGYQKPDVRAFYAFSSQLGVPVEECLFAGDHPEYDVDGARDAGMKAVLMDRSAGGEGGEAILKILGIASSGKSEGG